jgi:hypothetical protein
MSYGIRCANTHVRITDCSKLELADLENKLFDCNEEIPRRLDIIKVFLLGPNYENNSIYLSGIMLMFYLLRI